MTPRYCGCVIFLVALVSLGASPIGPRKKLPPEPIAILPAEPAWTVKLEGVPSAPGTMDRERVYVPLKDRGLRALSRDTGTVIWGEPFDITHAPLLAQGSLIVALPEEIRALDPLTGERRWARPLPRPLAAPLMAVGGVALLLTDTGEVRALRVSDGETVWRRQLEMASNHPPVSTGPSNVALTVGSRVMALDMQTGDVVWERTLPGTLGAAAAGRDRVFVGSTDNFLYALDAESGDERWKWRTGGDVIGAAADGDRVYFVSLDNVLRAVNRDNGNQLWKTAIPTRPSAPPVAFGDVVVLAGVAPRLDGYLGKTGAALGFHTALSDLQGMPMIDTAPRPFDVAIVVLTREGHVTGLRPTKLMFPDPPLEPLLKLPGRELVPDRPPRSKSQLPTSKSQLPTSNISG